MILLLKIIHIIAALGLIFMILIQTGRGMSLSGIFGGATESFLGGPGGDIFLKKVTVVIASIFMATSIALCVAVFKRRPVSLIEKTAPFVPR